MRNFLTFVATFACISVAHADANWPQFRGADSRGIAESKALPDQWAADKNVAWKTDIPGRGWSSPIVWGKKVFLTTVVNPAQAGLPKKGLYMGGEQAAAPDAVLQWKVICLDADSGKQLWDTTVHEGKAATPTHIKNSYASETPVTDGEHVYAYFGNVGVWCLDLNGKEVWKKEFPAHKTRYDWGTAASPALYEDRIYIVNDNEDDSSLAAYDKKTGTEIWRVPREEKSNWSTPFVWKNEKRTEIVTPGSGQVRSYDLDGKLLWSLSGMSGITISTPYAADGLLYVSSGYVGSKKRPLYAIKPGATGDISLPEGQTSNEWIAWCQPLGAPYNPTTLVVGDRIYVLYDRGFFSVFNAKDGSVIYDHQQIPNGQNFTSSPWAVGDKIFALNEDGNTFVFKTGDTFELLGENKLADDDMGMATPAIAGDALFIRTSARVYCIRNGAKG